jgi:hypothetical protein
MMLAFIGALLHALQQSDADNADFLCYDRFVLVFRYTFAGFHVQLNKVLGNGESK